VPGRACQKPPTIQRESKKLIDEYSVANRMNVTPRDRQYQFLEELTMLLNTPFFEETPLRRRILGMKFAQRDVKPLQHSLPRCFEPPPRALFPKISSDDTYLCVSMDSALVQIGLKHYSFLV